MEGICYSYGESEVSDKLIYMEVVVVVCVCGWGGGGDSPTLAY